MCTFLQKMHRKSVQFKRRVEKILRLIKFSWSRWNVCVCVCVFVVA